MPTRLTVYQGALRLLGPHQLASLEDNRPERLRLDEIWTEAVQYLLERGLWNFAIRSVEMSNDESYEPLWGYDYSFSKPDDFVRTVSLSDDPTFVRGFEDFETEGGYWFANAEPLYLRYVSSDPQYGLNIEDWPQAFTKALEAHMAFESGLPISGSEIAWTQVHVLRVEDGKVVEHWAVRDDFAMLEDIRNA